ncbi:MAG: iron ABC transporter permease, partial [Chloroflexi bacterium]|nr:iron ABC transporter permease [Chloroflexota bacterium]
FFAWAVTRTDLPFKGFIEVALWLGFFLPVLPMTLGWVLLLDPDYGLINKALMYIFGLTKAPLNVFSYWGIVWCHLAFSVSIRFLLLSPAFRSMDAALEEAARMSGSSNLGALFRIIIPILAPAILASVALGFIKSLESFEIEWILGNPAGISVASTKIYDFLHWEPPYYGRATALSGVFLVTIFFLVWLQRTLIGSREYTTVTGRGFSVRPIRLGPWRWVCCGFCLLFIFVMILLPLGTLIMGTFMNVFGFFDLETVWTISHWVEAFDDSIFLNSLMNTLILAAGATLIGVLFYALVSYAVIKTRFPGRGLMDFFSWLPWALPGVLLSLAMLWIVLGSGGILRFMYGTVMVLILAVIIKEMPLGTQMMKSGTMQISRELEESSRMSGASWSTTFRRIMLPLLNPTLISVGIVMIIISVREISAIVFLSSYSSRTISLLMMDYIEDQSLEKATVIGVFTVFLILTLLLIGGLLGLRKAPGAEGQGQ